jgi:hypothetical protein
MKITAWYQPPCGREHQIVWSATFFFECRDGSVPVGEAFRQTGRLDKISPVADYRHDESTWRGMRCSFSPPGISLMGFFYVKN